jgi:hypothetical protein
LRSTLFIFILLASNAIAQNAEKFCIENLQRLTKPSYWKQLSADLSKEEKEEIFRSLFEDNTFSYEKVIDESKVPDSVSVDGVWDSIFIAQHYFIDIDKDKDLDVLFSGAHYTGSTEGNYDIYINKNKKYLKKFHGNGQITYAGGKLDSVNAIIIYRSPVANRSEHMLEMYSCEKDKVELESALTFFSEVPPPLAESGTVELPVNTPMLINTKHPRGIASALDIGIVEPVNQFKQTSPFKYFATFKDSKGTDWYFVKVRSKDLLEPKYPEWKTILAWVRK